MGSRFKAEGSQRQMQGNGWAHLNPFLSWPPALPTTCLCSGVLLAEADHASLGHLRVPPHPVLPSVSALPPKGGWVKHKTLGPYSR